MDKDMIKGLVSKIKILKVSMCSRILSYKKKNTLNQRLTVD